MEGLVYMHNLKEFSFVIKRPENGNLKEPEKKQPLIPQLASARFQKLKKLEKLKLIFEGYPKLIVGNFISDFNCFPNLKSVEYVVTDQQQNGEIMINLAQLKSLTLVTLSICSAKRYSHFDT